jgi:multiple sugar transport system ATP-binding protein
MAEVVLKQVRKSFGKLETIHGVDIEMKDGEFIVLVGPSGCGKSTLLRLIAGLEDITSGTLHIGGVDVTDKTPKERGIAMVFQSYALYPHMTVYENMAFGLELSKLGKDAIDKRVRDAAELLKLTPLLERLPKAMSGGQRQRVAIGRAIVRDPKVFLFDEPLSNLDAALRVETRIEIAKLHERMGVTTVYVTHDQVEAMTLADKIVVLNAGNVEQVGSPLELYHRPNNLFVAGFIGSPMMNFIKGTVSSTSAKGVTIALPGGGSVTAAVSGDGLGTGDAVTLGVRPEHVVLATAGQVGGEVDVIEELGESYFAYVRIADGTMVTVRQHGDSTINRHEKVSISIPGDACHVFRADKTAQKRLATNA